MNVRSLMDTRQTDRRTQREREREREMCASANVDTVTHDRCDHMPPPPAAAAAAAAVTSVLLRRRVCRRRLPPVNVHIQLYKYINSSATTVTSVLKLNRNSGQHVAF